MKAKPFLLLGLLCACASTPAYRPPDFNAFFQGQWVRQGQLCDTAGECDQDGTGQIMLVAEDQIALKASAAAEPEAIFLFRFGPSDRLRLTDAETGRTFLGTVVFRTEKEILIESRRVPASFEKWVKP